MRKQQIFLVSGGLLALILLYFFGNTTPPPSAKNNITTDSSTGASTVSTASILESAKKNLTAAQSAKILQLENSVVRGDVKDQKIKVYKQLAEYWQDTLNRQDLAAFYFGESAKLENSEKNLTFAARLFFNQVMAESNPMTLSWLASNAKDLYEKALEINPNNDSAKIELGACYLFGNLSKMPMEGILKIKEVADRDTNNMYAQLMLGLGDIRSQQYDKAIERLEKVVQKEPGNIQAAFNLAETYERKGDKQNAIKWYQQIEKTVSMPPEAKQELENRINSLK